MPPMSTCQSRRSLDEHRAGNHVARCPNRKSNNLDHSARLSLGMKLPCPARNTRCRTAGPACRRSRGARPAGRSRCAPRHQDGPPSSASRKPRGWRRRPTNVAEEKPVAEAASGQAQRSHRRAGTFRWPVRGQGDHDYGAKPTASRMTVINLGRVPEGTPVKAGKMRRGLLAQ